MPPPGSADATILLKAASRGDRSAASTLFPIIYEALRQRAAAYLGRERPDHTLQPTALANEVYLRLVDQTQIDWRGRTHFMAAAAETMRRVLVDHARHKGAAKRGGGHKRVPLADYVAMSDDWSVHCLDLTGALEELGTIDSRAARIIELRFFGGLTEKEVGSVIGLSDRAVRKEWAWARTWLRHKLKGSADDGK